jgi:hypothetical protein
MVVLAVPPIFIILKETRCMKITMEVECTPEEARRFLGLPDVAPLQEAVLAQWRERLDEVGAATSPETLLRGFMPFTSQVPEAFLRAMASAMPGGAGPGVAAPRRDDG